MAASTARRRCSLTCGEPCSTRETTDFETPALVATARRVTEPELRIRGVSTWGPLDRRRRGWSPAAGRREERLERNRRVGQGVERHELSALDQLLGQAHVTRDRVPRPERARA